MEGILKQILDGQQQLITRMNKLEDGQQQLITRMNKLEDGQQQLITRMNKLEDGQQQLFTEVAKTNARLDDMPTKADLEKTIMEQQKDVISLLERTATKDAVVKVDTKIDLINNKLFQTETEIALLKLVK